MLFSFYVGFVEGLMYLIAALVFAIFFIWLMFDLYNYLLRTGKYEMIKHDHNFLDFLWILFFGKEFPWKKKKEYEYEIKIAGKKEPIKTNKNHKNESIKADTLKKGKNEQSKNIANTLEKKVIVEKKLIDEKETSKESEIQIEPQKNLEKASSKVKENESSYLIAKIEEKIKKISALLEKDFSKEFHPGFYHRGKEITNLLQLAMEIKSMNREEFNHYVNESKNDFYNWINDVIKDKLLAKNIKDVKTKITIYELLVLRYSYFIYLKKLLTNINNQLKEIKNLGPITTNAKLVDLLYNLETSPIEYKDFVTEINAITQYLELSKLQNKDVKKEAYRALKEMGFNKELIDIVFNYFYS